MSHFELDYAITAFRSQSQTIDGPVVIAEVNKMSFEELWVALSRCTKFEYVTLSDLPSPGQVYPHTPFVHKTFVVKEALGIHGALYEIEVVMEDGTVRYYYGKSVSKKVEQPNNRSKSDLWSTATGRSFVSTNR
jgi:hypothetical protein